MEKNWAGSQKQIGSLNSPDPFLWLFVRQKKKHPQKPFFGCFKRVFFLPGLLLVAGLAGFCWACWVLPVLSEPFHTNLYGMNGFCRTCWVLQYLLGFAGFAVFFFFLL